MEPEELERAVEAVLFAAGEPVELKRLSQALGCETAGIPYCKSEAAGFQGYYRYTGILYGAVQG